MIFIGTRFCMNNLLEDAIFNLRSTVHHSWRETLCRDSSAPVSRALATPSFKGRAEYDTSERRIRESFPCWQRFRRFFSRGNRRGVCVFFLTNRFHWMRLPDADGAYRFWATRKRVWSANDQTSYLAEHTRRPRQSLERVRVPMFASPLDNGKISEVLCSPLITVKNRGPGHGEALSVNRRWTCARNPDGMRGGFARPLQLPPLALTPSMPPSCPHSFPHGPHLSSLALHSVGFFVNDPSERIGDLRGGVTGQFSTLAQTFD